MSVHTLHDVASSTHPLGVECENCIRRALVSKDALKAQRGDPRPVSITGLHCSKCGSRQFSTTLFQGKTAAHSWLRNH